MEALGINLGYLLVQVLNFAILLVVLRAWVFKPIVRLLERRRQTIAQGLEDARIAAEARANAEKEAQSIMTKAQQEAGQRLREASERAEQVGREIRAQAEKEAAETREAAVGEAEQTRIQALAELRGQVAALAIAAAQKLIGESLDQKRQQTLIAEFFSGIRKGQVVLLEDEGLQGSEAHVTSALPLSQDEQATLRREVEAKLGAGSAIHFQVDPSILGGLVIRVGDKVLDGSVGGKLQALRQTLQ
ncbi:MAG TPA: F0F1 ATP synthase subunit B [Anaerolineales bacterium]|nr:F0F1 ATP synthase subunit B [Anaerolineales bacterium]